MNRVVQIHSSEYPKAVPSLSLVNVTKALLELVINTLELPGEVQPRKIGGEDGSGPSRIWRESLEQAELDSRRRVENLK